MYQPVLAVVRRCYRRALILLSEEEKGLLLRYRNERISKEERIANYRRTISPENINRLMKMPDHPTIKNELFQLIEEVIAC